MSFIEPNTTVDPKPESVAQNTLATEYRKTFVEIHSQLFDKAATYTNLIMVGGYAGAFTVWGNTRMQLTDRANIIIALLLGISLCVFVGYQVYKMAAYVKHFRKVRALLADSLPIDEFFVGYSRIQRETGQITLGNGTVVSSFYFWLCVGPAVFAIALLFYDFFASLMGWPIFPAASGAACISMNCVAPG